MLAATPYKRRVCRVERQNRAAGFMPFKPSSRNRSNGLSGTVFAGIRLWNLCPNTCGSAQTASLGQHSAKMLLFCGICRDREHWNLFFRNHGISVEEPVYGRYPSAFSISVVSPKYALFRLMTPHEAVEYIALSADPRARSVVRYTCTSGSSIVRSPTDLFVTQGI